MFYLKELYIEKFHLLNKPIKVLFNKKSNYLLGKNGTGKTTLLEIISAFFKLDFDNIGQGKDVMATALFQSKTDAEITVNVKYSSTTNDTRSNLIGLDSIDELIDINIKTPEGSIILISENGSYSLKFPDSEEMTLKPSRQSNSLGIRALAHINDLNTNTPYIGSEISSKVFMWFFENHTITRFSEGLENEKAFFYKEIPINNTKEDNIEILSQDSIVNEKLMNKKEARTMLSNIKRSLIDKTDYEENLIISKKDSSILQRISDYINVENIRVNYKLEDINLKNHILTLILSPSHVSIILKNSSVINYYKLSYGERRIFQLVMNFYNNKSAIFLDEPVNGFHGDFIEKIEEMKNDIDAQVFIANQTPTLFDYIEVDNPQDFMSKFIFCTKKDNNMTWNNPNESESDSFMKHYDNQFLHVSKILKKLKLW